MDDINEQQRCIHYIETVSAISQHALYAPLDDVLRRATSQVAHALDADYVSVVEQSIAMPPRIRAAHGLPEEARGRRFEDHDTHGDTLRHADETLSSQHDTPLSHDVEEPGASLAVPLEARGHTVATLEIATVRVHDWTRSERIFVQSVAGVLAEAYLHARTTDENELDLYRTLIEHSTDAIMLFDPQGMVLYASPTTESVLGHLPSEFLNSSGSQVIHPHDLAMLRQEFTAVEGTPGGSVTVECRVDHKQRGYIWIELVAKNLRDSNTINALLVNIRDIHARKQIEIEFDQFLADTQHARQNAEEAVAQVRLLQIVSDTALLHLELNELLNELLRRICEVLPSDAAAVYLLDSDATALTVQATVNLEMSEELTTYHPIGRGIVGGIAANRLPTIVDDLTVTHPTDELSSMAELRSIAGVPLMVDDQVRGVLFIGSRVPNRYTGGALDLLERAAARASMGIERAQLYAEMQSALQVRHELLAVAAHELKTPLASLLGYSQLLQARAQTTNVLDERMTRPLRVMTEQVHRLNRLVNRLLDLSQIENSTFVLQRGSIDLVDVVRNVVETVRSAIELHTIEEQYPDVPVMVYGDTIRLEQVMHNLLGNALKYSPWGGTIVVNLTASEDEAVVSVTDPGIGIPLDEQEKLFQPFYRAKSTQQQFQGLGIGLYVVRETVEQHGGSVEVRSARGEGSTFIVRVPKMPNETTSGD